MRLRENVASSIRTRVAKRLHPTARLAFALSSLATAANAQTWDGGAATGNWSDALNWSTDAVPLSGAAVSFGGTVQTTVDLQADRIASTLTFTAGADPFTLNNQTLRLSATSGTALNNASASLQTINSALQNSGSVTYAATSGALTLNGNLRLSNSASNRTLTFNAANAINVTGIIANGGTSTASGLTKTGTGTLTLSGANTYGGQTRIAAGTVRATQASSLGTGTLRLDSGSTLQLVNDASTNFGRNVPTFGNSTTQIDRATAGAGVTHTLGTLAIASSTLTLTAGSNITSGTAGLTYGTTSITGNPVFDTAANTRLTLGPLTLSGATARSLTKRGTGELVLGSTAGVVSPLLTLTVNRGTARFGATNALGNAAQAAVTVNSNAAGATALFDLNGFDQTVRALVFGGTGGTTTSTSNVSTGAGTLTLAGNVTYTATGNPLGSTLSGNLALGSATRTFNIGNSTTAADDLTVSAAITGNPGAGLLKSGTGNLVLSNAANSFNGPVSVTAGTLTVSSLANVGTASALGAPSNAANGTISIGATTSGATLTYTGGTTTTDRVLNLAGTTGGATLRADGTGPLVFTSALTATGAGSKTLVLRGTSTADNTLAGAIVNNSATNRTSLLKTDVGTWLISGTNTYTGTTTVNNGILKLGSSASLAPTAVTVNANSAGATALLDLNGHNATVSSLTLGGTGSTATSTANVATGAGTLTLGGTLTYSATGNPLGSTISGNLSLGAATRTFAVNNSTTAAADLTITAALTGTGTAGLTKTGTGTLVLSGPGSYAGATSVSTGILRAGAAGAFSPSSTFALSTGTTLALDGFNQTIGALSGTGNVTLGSAVLATGANGAATTFSGVASGTGGLEKQGSGVFTVSATQTYTGPTTVSAGTLSLSGAANRLNSATSLAVASGATLLLNNNALTVSSLSGDGTVSQGTGAFNVSGSSNTTFGGTLTGSGTFTKSGSGTLTLSGANTHTGAFAVTLGKIILASPSALGSTAGQTTVSDGAALGVQGGVSLAAETINLRGSGSGSGAFYNVAGSNTFTGNFNLLGDTTIGSEAGVLTLGGSVAFNGHSLTFGGAGDLNLALSLGASASFTKTGDGTLALTTAQSSSGTITLAGGTLALSDLIHTFGTLNVTADSVLDFGGSASRLNLTDLIVAPGVTLTVTNWVDTVDFLYASNNPGIATLGNVIFTPFSPGSTKYFSGSGEITPVPEPARYGAVATIGLFALLTTRRGPRRHPANLRSLAASQD